MNGVESAEEVTKEVDAIVAYLENKTKKSGAISVDGLYEGEEMTNDDFSLTEDTEEGEEDTNDNFNFSMELDDADYTLDGIELIESTDSS